LDQYGRHFNRGASCHFVSSRANGNFHTWR
jgi:hypothetical protein